MDLLQNLPMLVGSLKRLRKNRSALFRGRHFEDEIIILGVRWYLHLAPPLLAPGLAAPEVKHLEVLVIFIKACCSALFQDSTREVT